MYVHFLSVLHKRTVAELADSLVTPTAECMLKHSTTAAVWLEHVNTHSCRSREMQHNYIGEKTNESLNK